MSDEIKEVEKSFYLIDDKNISKKLTFYKGDEIVMAFDDEEVDPSHKAVGEVVYTLEIPTWAKRNMIKEGSVTPTLIGTSSLNPYTMNTLIISYLLKDWSIEKKLEFEEDSRGFQVIKDVDALLNSDIKDYIFDGVIKVYNRYIN